MRKFTYFYSLLLTALFLLPWSGMKAEGSLKIGSNDTYTTNSPVWGNKANNYVMSQIIYPATSLTSLEGKQITKLTFYTRSSYASNVVWNDMQICITERSTATFASSTDWEDISGLTPLYTGQIDATGSSVTLTLSSPYVYNGGNLLIDIRNTKKTNAASSGKPRWQATSASNTVLYDYSSSSSTPSSWAELNNKRPDVQFTYEDAPAAGSCPKPKNLSASEVLPDKATFAWEQNVDETTYQWACVAAGAEVSSWNDLAEGVRTATVTGLTNGSSYDFHVRSYCGAGEGEQSESVKKNFTTSCPAPTAVTVPAATIGSNSAEMSWTGVAGITDYQYSVVAKGASANWGTAVLVEGATSTTITGLSASTEYDVYVRSYYSSTIQSTPATKVTFKTACGAVALPFNEAFSSIGCWTTQDANGSTGINSNAFRFYYDNTYTQYLISPEFVASANQLKIEFKYWVQSASYPESFRVGYSTTTSDVSAFTWMTTQSGLTNTSSAKATYKETLPATGIKYVAIHYNVTGQYALFIDDFKAEEYVAPSCANPTGLTVDNITANSAQVSWTSDASSFALEYSNDGNTWTAATGTITNPFTLSGLDPDKTRYYVRVKAICSVGNESDWVSSNAFYTECGTKAFGWSEDFASENLPACWEAQLFGTGNGQWRIYDGQARYNGRVVSTNTNDLTTPSIVLPAEDAMLQFYHQNGNVKIEVGVTNGTTTVWKEVSKNTSLKVDTIHLSAFKNQTVNFIFRAYGYSASSTVYAYIDDVTVVYKPVAVPTLADPQPTPDGAALTWSHPEAGPFEVRYSLSGEEDWTTVSNVTTQSYTITGLSAVEYDVQVRATISEHRVSDWSGIKSFTPECSAPVSLAATAETYNSVELGWTGAAKALRYKADGAAADWTNVSLSAATSYTLSSLTTGTAYTIQVQAACATDDTKWSDEFVFTPACAAPAYFTVSGTTINWNAGNGEAEWSVLYRKLGAADWNTIPSVATQSYTFSGLEAGTTYQVKVASVCGAETAVEEFTTACPATYALPFTENFNGLSAVKTLPNCWNASDEASKWSNMASGHEGTAVQFNSGWDNAEGNINYLKSPAIAVTADARIEFWYRNPFGGDLSVYYTIDDGATVQLVPGATGLTNQADWKKAIYNLPSECNGKNVILMFKGTSNASIKDECYISIDDVKVELQPTCVEPSGLEATAIGTATATIEWTAGSSETAWKLQYKAESDADWSAEQSVATTPSFDLSGLTANTLYYVRVKADCGSGNESEYTDGTFSFRTECDAQPMPFVENFGNTLPLCWSTAESGADAWAPNASKYVSATRSVKFNAKTAVGNYADLITPIISVSDESTLKFQLWNSSYYGTVTGALYVNQVDADHKLMDLPETTGWEQQEFDLEDYIGQNVKFIFRAYGNGTDELTEMDIDDVEVKVKPCDAPAFTAENVFVTADGATISCAESNWSLRYKKTADADWTEQTSISTASYTLIGLDEVEYEVQIRTDCSATRNSEWTASETFTPECLAPVDVTVSGVSVDRASIAWLGAAEKLQYREYKAAEPFDDWTDATGAISSPFALTGLNASTKYEVRVKATCGDVWSAPVAFTTWCDAKLSLPVELTSFSAIPACWEESPAGAIQIAESKLCFVGEGERFLYLPQSDINLSLLSVTLTFSGSLELGYISEPNGAFTSLVASPVSGTEYNLASLAPEAAGYLAIRYNGASSLAQSAISAISIRRTPSCLMPTGVTATPGAGSAEISWTAGGSESAWNLQYKKSSASSWSESIAVSTNPYVLSGLDQGIKYKVRVQAACAGEDLSDWTDEIEFTTQCADIASIPWDADFSANLSNCWTIHCESPEWYSPMISSDGLQIPGGNSGHSNVVVLPGFTPSLTPYTITLRYKCDKGAGNATPQIGYVTAKDEKETFVVLTDGVNEIGSLEKSSSFKTVYLPLANLPGGATNLAIRYAGGTSEGDLIINEFRISRVEIFEDDEVIDNETRLNGLKLAGQLDFVMARPILSDGDYNTICLPFNMSASQLADDKCPLNGFEVRKYDHANVDLSMDLVDLFLKTVSEIEAGTAYFIRNLGATKDIQYYADFRDVTISASAVANPTSDAAGILFKGAFNPFELEGGNPKNLYLSTGSLLYYPDVDFKVKGFRGYVLVDEGGSALPAIRRGAKVRISEPQDAPTGVDKVQNDNVQCTKVLEGNQVIIIRNGVKYTIQGQKIQ